MSNFIPHMLSSLEYAFAIITLLGGVIAVHEFGHFIFAKWCGIRVDTFSIGFGPKLFTKKYGETEYCLSLIPLGGFVKIYGQDPEELAKDENPEPKRAFSKKNLAQKISVLAGGPAFNYILSIFIFAILAVAGTQKLPALATRIVFNTPAFHAGLRSGDVINSIGGKATHNFEEVEQEIATNADKTLDFAIKRDGKDMNLQVTIAKENAASPYGDISQAGALDGLEPFGREAVFAVSGDNHPWGIKNGDKLIRFDGLDINSWEDLEAAVEAKLQKLPEQLNFTILRGTQKIELVSAKIAPTNKQMNSAWNVQSFLDSNKLYNPELFVDEVMRGSPADKAGIKKADHMLAVNGKPVYSFEHLRNTIQSSVK